jgi:hypothetical protein
VAEKAGDFNASSKAIAALPDVSYPIANVAAALLEMPSIMRNRIKI